MAGGRPARNKFETSLARLEKIVERLEGEDLSLEESLRAFEEGMALARQCRRTLDQAEKKIEILLREGAGEEARPWEPAGPGGEATDPEAGA